MPASFTKFKKDGGGWGVRIEAGDAAQTGDVVEVEKRGGKTEEVKLGELVMQFRDGNRVYRFERQKEQIDVEPGLYEKDGTVYKVEATRGGSHLVAKKLKFSYAKGAIYDLSPEDRMTDEAAGRVRIWIGEEEDD